MTEVRCNLVVQLDEHAQCFTFRLQKKQGEYSSETADFSVEISFEELNARGLDGAQKLVGESVLGFFDHLTKGRLDIPRREP